MQSAINKKCSLCCLAEEDVYMRNGKNVKLKSYQCPDILWQMIIIPTWFLIINEEMQERFSM
jgi:hypothetical protein